MKKLDISGKSILSTKNDQQLVARNQDPNIKHIYCCGKKIIFYCCRSPVGRRQGSRLEHTHPPQTQNCMIESESSLFQKTKVGGPYEYTPKQLLNLTTTPKIAHWGPQKPKITPKLGQY